MNEYTHLTDADYKTIGEYTAIVCGSVTKFYTMGHQVESVHDVVMALDALEGVGDE